MTAVPYLVLEGAVELAVPAAERLTAETQPSAPREATQGKT